MSADRIVPLVLVLMSSACTQVFGLDEPVPAPSDALDAPARPDAPVDAPRPCPDTYMASGGAHYRFNESRARWLDAAIDCADDAAAGPPYTHLIVFGDDAERLAILPLRSASNDAYWIGLTDLQTAGSWIWVTAEPTDQYPPSTGAPWSSGQPMSGADCAELVGPLNGVGENGMLNADYCNPGATVSLPYICECDAYADDPSRH